jgi:RNA polymerase sigma factor (sigma-70 family)
VKKESANRKTRAGVRAGLRRVLFAPDDRLVAFVRRGDSTAFEVLYDRHCGELLSFARHMLGSPDDAEDAVQATFVSAYKALLADDRDIDLRPWLFAIARNACLSILRKRPLASQPGGAMVPRGDPVATVEQREELSRMTAALLELPELQRAALVMSEMHGLNHSDIGALLGVRPEQVKSYVYQARSSLISDRQAREADCLDIRKELAAARGPALLRSRLRRHLRSCPGCHEYSQELSRQRRQLGILFPVAPWLALKRRALEAALGKAPGPSDPTAGSSVGATVELVGGGANALVAKLLVGVACLGAGTGVGAAVLGVPSLGPAHEYSSSSSPSHGAAEMRLTASVVPAAGAQDGERTHGASQPPAQPQLGNAPAGVAGQERRPSTAAVKQISQAAISDSTPDAGTHKSEEAHGKSGEAHGKSEELHGKSEEAHGNGGEAHGKSEELHGKSEEAHGNGGDAHGKSEEPHGKSGEADGNGGEAHGKSEEAHAGSGEAHGSSGEDHGKSEEVHGKP